MFSVNRRVFGNGAALVDVSNLGDVADDVVAPCYASLGEGVHFSDPLAAVIAAARVLDAWNASRRGQPARLAVTHGSKTRCFYDAQVSRAMEWARSTRGVA